ncbi:MAG TPA: VOC family protein [Acidimicrobiales bacterium]|nr:VOC family protein [Acidimicrobiales bacterium]
MSEPLPAAERFGLGAIDQVSYAVADVEEAARRYGAIFGHFEVAQVPPMAVTYRGRPATVALRLGFARSGPVEIELVEVLEGECPARDHLLAHGEGVHHVRFPVSDLAATRAAMEADRWVTTFAGESGEVSFAYLEPPGGTAGPVIELIRAAPPLPSSG